MKFIVQILNFSFTFPNYLLHNVLIVQSRKGLLHIFDTFAYHLISIISNHLIKKKKEKKIKRGAGFVFLGKCVYLCGALFDKCGIIRKRFAMQVKIEESWRQQLQPQFDSAYFEILTNFVRRAYQTTTCYPPGRFIFEAFNRTPFDKVKVVILGQDPYHEPGQAHGLCFSVQPGIALPPSLLNIYKELVNEFGQPPMVMPGADPSPCSEAWPTVMRARDGRHSPTLPSRRLPTIVRTSSSCFGDAMPATRRCSSTDANIACSNVRILRPSRPTTGSSAATTSPCATTTCSSTG